MYFGPLPSSTFAKEQKRAVLKIRSDMEPFSLHRYDDGCLVRLFVLDSRWNVLLWNGVEKILMSR